MGDATAGGCDVWREAAAWIERNGGRVHPQLQYDGALRRVYLGDPSRAANASDVDGGSNEVSIGAGTALLEIPDACLVTLHSAELDEAFGKSLFGAVHSLATAEEDGRGENVDGEGGLHHDAQDVILALFLAYLRERLDLRQNQKEPSQSSNANAETASGTPWLFYRPYLATLPSSSSSESSASLLPRQWPAATLKRRLEGTSLYQRVLKEQRGLRREYDLVRNAWMEKLVKKTDGGEGNEGSAPFPSLEQYDCMMAVLTSRGFSGLGFDGVDALIPLLDLLNHVRGKKDGGRDAPDAVADERNESDASGPDVRYQRYVGNCREDEEAPSKRQRTKEKTNSGVQCEKGKGGVLVSAARQLECGSELHMTYGAKGNAALLGRYGFCIANNVEPDGSCNDVLELAIRPDEKPVELRRGPKSYSYAPFVRALDLCRDDAVANGGNEGPKSADGARGDEHEEVVGDGGLDAFLDSCENGFDDNDNEDEEEGDGEDADDYLYNSHVNSDAGHARDPDRASMEGDLGALDKLKEILQTAKAGLMNNPLAQSLQNGSSQGNDTSEDRYCAILVRSEIETLDFYLAATNALRLRLDGHLEEQTSLEDDTAQVTMDPGGDSTNVSDGAVARGQIDALVDAYVSIRYPGVEMQM